MVRRGSGEFRHWFGHKATKSQVWPSHEVFLQLHSTTGKWWWVIFIRGLSRTISATVWKILLFFLSRIDEKATQHVSVIRTWIDSSFRTQPPPVFRLHVAAQQGVPECKQLINIMTALMSSSGAQMKTLTGKVVSFFFGNVTSLVIFVAMETAHSEGHRLLPTRFNAIGALNPNQESTREKNPPIEAGVQVVTAVRSITSAVFFLFKTLY